MNYKPYPEHFWTEINSTIEQLKKQNAPLIAAFDADGTLWDTDLGENFFQYQIDHKAVPLPSEPWDYYFDLKKTNNDPRPAYAWLAQINEGKSIEQVRTWADHAFNQITPKPIFSEQQKLIDLLKSQSVQIYIVTASVKWAVEPGARALGLTNDQVIGIETFIENNIITKQAKGAVTYREGKVTALLEKTNGVKPFLASGNTIGDYELLKSATHLRLAVSAAAVDDRIYKTEKQLAELAETENWWRHRFI